MDLIKINRSENGMTVDGRELHEFLEVGTRFNDWIERQVAKYGFSEGEDFYSILSKTSEGGRPRTDYELSIEMAKELCMVENNEKGREARKYFIECERRYKQQSLDISMLSPELQMFKQIFDGVARMQLEAAATKQELVEVKSAVTTIQEIFLQRDDDWRKSINSMLNGAVFRSGGDYREYRNESYQLIEERGHCDLGTRLRNLKDRLGERGATKSKIENTTKMDVIESDPRLKEIYTTIVKEMSIGSLKVTVKN